MMYKHYLEKKSQNLCTKEIRMLFLELIDYQIKRPQPVNMRDILLSVCTDHESEEQLGSKNFV